MCGLTGILTSAASAPGVDQQVAAMTAALAHRGPDDDGVWHDRHLALGHRRLSIIDLSTAGHQPMHSADGRSVLVYNGEIYNFRALRRELADYPYRSQTDSEVILAAYARWGIECLSHFQGMFAFALWDRTTQTLFLARDRLGIKPLYYCAHEGGLVFASEIRALLRSGLVDARLDRLALVDYLRYQTVHAPRTILDGVRMLPAGHYLLARPEHGITTHAYWSMLRSTPPVACSREERKREVLRVFRAAVEKRLVADVPFGAFLSGGIDSSAVVAMMAQTGAAVKTFNVSFSEHAYSEAYYARIVARAFNTEHHEIQLSPQRFLALIPEALGAMDHPSGDGPNTYIVSKATKEAGVSMALSGLGGDELFAGYPVFTRLAQLERWQRWLNALPAATRRSGSRLINRLRPSIAAQKIGEVLADTEVSALSAYRYNRQVFAACQLADLLTTPLPPNAVEEQMNGWRECAEFDALPLFSKISVAEMSTYMQNVLLRDTDQMSMAHALEVRVPFLDHELVELVLRIPDAVKYPHTPKQLLVESLGDLLPREIVDRPKMGFTLPFKEWMANELRDFCAVRLHALGARPYFHAATVQRLWDDFLSGRPTISWSRLWVLVVLEEWLEKNGVA